MSERILAEMLGGPMDGDILHVSNRARYVETYVPSESPVFPLDVERITYTDSGLTVYGRRLFTAPGFAVREYGLQLVVDDRLAMRVAAEKYVESRWLLAASAECLRVLDGPRLSFGPELRQGTVTVRALGFVLIEEGASA